MSCPTTFRGREIYEEQSKEKVLCLKQSPACFSACPVKFGRTLLKGRLFWSGLGCVWKKRGKWWLFFLHCCLLLEFQCHAELAGDVPRAVGPHRAALSLVIDRETKGQLWAFPLYSDRGCRFSPSVAGLSVWLSLPLLVERSQAECICGRTNSHLSALPLQQ